MNPVGHTVDGRRGVDAPGPQIYPGNVCPNGLGIGDPV